MTEHHHKVIDAFTRLGEAKTKCVSAHKKLRIVESKYLVALDSISEILHTPSESLIKIAYNERREHYGRCTEQAVRDAWSMFEISANELNAAITDLSHAETACIEAIDNARESWYSMIDAIGLSRKLFQSPHLEWPAGRKL